MESPHSRTGEHSASFFQTAMDALQIINWGKCENGSMVIEVKCQSPDLADDMPSTITDTKHQEYKKWGFDPARRAAVYYAAPATPTDSSHAE